MGTDLVDLRVYQLAEELAQVVWDVVATWERFARSTVGEQLVRAADSIGANISEAYGRYHYGEKLRFLYYARGSLYETRFWLRQALKRQLIRREQADTIAQLIHPLAVGLNNFAASIRQQQNNRPNNGEIREEPITYGTPNISQSLSLPISTAAIIFSDEELSCLHANAS